MANEFLRRRTPTSVSPPSTGDVLPSGEPAIEVLARVTGIVQGVGFRAWVAALARRLGVSGTVRHERSAVVVEAVGSADAIPQLLEALRHGPQGADVHEVIVERMLAQAVQGVVSFVIDDSSVTDMGPPTTVSPDIGICPACLQEVRSTGSRRFGDPFASCNACGPRFSIVVDVPWDRERTSMSMFEMCSACRAEYDDPLDRHGHAQTISCPQCGPGLRWLDGKGQLLAGGTGGRDASEILREAARALRDGKIIAILCLGGFQLVVDATAANAVARLRAAKHRAEKPFPVLVEDVDDARELAHVSQEEAHALAAPGRPIVICQVRTDAEAKRVDEGVSPHSSWIGLTLPSTALQALLLRHAGVPLVCTSGSGTDEPLSRTEEDAMRHLSGVADFFVSHSRLVQRSVEDSVGRVVAGRFRIQRRGRGETPRPVVLARGSTLPILALGGQLDGAVAAVRGRNVLISDHLGDLSSGMARRKLRSVVDDCLSWMSARPAVIACDRHPDYATTLLAEELADQLGARLLRVGHHSAHVGSVLLESETRDGPLNEPAVGFAWDSSGYGDDGRLWGGEAFFIEHGHTAHVGTLRAFPLPGGEQAAQDPRLSAVGMLYEMDSALAADVAHRFYGAAEAQRLLKVLGAGLAPLTTSVGRMIDAVAALTGIRTAPSFDGQAAMLLEQAGATEQISDEERGLAPWVVESVGGVRVADWSEILRAVVEQTRAGVEPGAVSRAFFVSLVDLMVAQSGDARTIAVSGSCFDNGLLLASTIRRFERAGRRVLASERFPQNDGGLCLGQLYWGRALLDAV